MATSTRKAKAIGFNEFSKTTPLHVPHAFLYISLPSLHDYGMKMPNFTFCGDVNTRQRLSLSFPDLRFRVVELSMFGELNEME